MKEFYAKEYEEIYGHKKEEKPKESKFEELKRLALEVLGDELSSDEDEESESESHKRFKSDE